MAILQELFATLLQAAEKSWKGQLNEDKLKCRLSALENQLQTCTQSHSKWSLKRILLEMEDQKQNYELKAKESLQKLLEEKLQVEGQLQNAQRALAVAEEDCALWKEHYNTLNEDWSQLTDKHIELENNLHVLENKLQVASLSFCETTFPCTAKIQSTYKAICTFLKTCWRLCIMTGKGAQFSIHKQIMCLRPEYAQWIVVTHIYCSNYIGPVLLF
uniref:TRAF3 interacting protein 3 n=1 Tax=Podarcis muralis TaxID=64176 RepID=A0A670IB90_PODMU